MLTSLFEQSLLTIIRTLITGSGRGHSQFYHA